MAADMSSLEVAYRVMATPDPHGIHSGLFPHPRKISSQPRKVIGVYKNWFNRADEPVKALCQQAIDYYVEALKINSFMWDAFTGLCDIGAVVRPHNIFKITPDMLPFVPTPALDPFNPSSRQPGDGGLNLGGSSLLSKLNGRATQPNSHTEFDTPPSNGQNMHDEHVMMGETGGPVMSRAVTSRVRTKTNPDGDQTDIPRPVYQNGHKRTVSGHSLHQSQNPPSQPLDPTAAPPRRSVRLLNSITQIRPSNPRQGGALTKEAESKERRELRKARAAAPKARSGTTSTVGRVVSGNRKAHVEISEQPKPEGRSNNSATTAVALALSGKSRAKCEVLVFSPGSYLW